MSYPHKVTSLIGAHTDSFTSILKSHRGSVSMAALEELPLVTGVIGHSGVGQDWSSQDSIAVGAGMMHIQRLMLGLIPHYWDRQVSGCGGGRGGVGVRVWVCVSECMGEFVCGCGCVGGWVGG